MEDLGSYFRLIRDDKKIPRTKLIYSLLKNFLWNRVNRYAWKGIYPSWDKLPLNKDTEFDNPEWLFPLYLATKKIKDDLEKNRPVREKWAHRHLALAAGLLAARPEGVRILDIGGGMAGAFLYLLSAQIPRHKIRYYVLEKESVCVLGRSLLGAYENVSFDSSPEADFRGVDIVYLSTALQYFDDVGQIFSKIKSFGPGAVLFHRLTAGDIPDFWTLQRNIPGASTPYHFMNIGQMTEAFQEDYDLVFHERTRHPYSMRNFPEAYRLKTLSHMLFKKKDRHD